LPRSTETVLHIWTRLISITLALQQTQLYPDELCHLRLVAEDNSVHSEAITCECEVHSMLSSVKKTSPGADDIPYWVFKYCAVELTPVVTYLINTIISNGTPPPTWLKALVTHVPKKTP